MSERYSIRVTKEDNQVTKWELMREGEKVDTLSFWDLVGLGIQCFLALQWVGK